MLCKGISGILIVGLTFYSQWHLFQVQRQPPCSDGSPCLGSNSRSLASLTGATFEVVIARCKSCSSELFSVFDGFESIALQQRSLHKNVSFGTTTSYHGLKVVLRKDGAEQKNKAVKCKVVGWHQHSQCNPALCYVWEALLF